MNIFASTIYGAPGTQGLPTPYVWWDDHGAIHDLISGPAASGKTEFAAQLIEAGRDSNGLIVDWVAAPNGGRYDTLRNDVTCLATSHADIVDMIRAASEEMHQRGELLRKANQRTWRATEDMPLFVITFDDIPLYLYDNSQMTQLITLARKTGIKVRIVVQTDEALTAYMRDHLGAGQLFTFSRLTNPF